MKRLEDKFMKASTMLFMLNMMASFLNYVCQIFFAKFLSVDDFGTINIIFSFMTIISIPGISLTMTVTKFYAELGEGRTGEKGKTFFCNQIVAVTSLTVLVLVLLILFRSPLGKILVIEDNLVLFLALVLMSIGFYQPLYSGIFAGHKRFILVGVYSLLIPIYKIVSIVLSYLFSNNVRLRLHYTLLFMIFGTIVVILWGQIKTNSMIGEWRLVLKKGIAQYLYGFDKNTLFLNASLMLYMNMDLFVVRYRGNEHESGLYSAVLLFGRILYYLSTTLGTILLPSVADTSIIQKQKIRTLNKMIIVLCFFSGLFTMTFSIGGKWIVIFLYGTDYLQALKYLKYVIIISFSLSLYTVLINYAVGTSRTKFATKVMIFVDTAVLVSVYLVSNIEIVLSAIGLIGFIGASAIYAGELYVWRKGRSRQ